ncbi:hypothetical protein CPB86DRAFT_773278 [Serendipita vermifera]|nr:hypothetical protein CPB86DRAFT_773278 [Serendipita vermifera]
MTLYDIAKKPASLRPYLSSLTSIDPAAMIMFLSDGQQLREDNLRELSGVQDQTIFVFNRDYLDLEVEEVMELLSVKEGEGLIPSGSIEVDSISSLHASQILEDHLQRAQQHQSYVSALFQQIHSQYEALMIASSNLDMHVLTLTEAWATLKESIGAGLEVQAKLLEGIDYDLDAISHLSVHPGFLAIATKGHGPPATPNQEKDSESVNEASAAGTIKKKMLGEYVSRPKMKMVVESCRKVHNDLVARFRNAHASMDELVKGSNEIRLTINPDGILSEASQCTKRSLDTQERIGLFISTWRESEGIAIIYEPHHQDAVENLLKDIKSLDQSLRNEVSAIGEIKNRHTRHLLMILRRISNLQSSIAALPSALSGLENDLRVKGGFAHLQRLHGMAFAYGASVIEVVRRREFGRFFTQRAQAMAEIMAKFSSSERKRRQVYRGESLSLLPFETQGMDLPAPSLEITTLGMDEGPYNFEREDVDALIQTMRQIEEEWEHYSMTDTRSSSEKSYHPIRDTREALEKLVARMENLEADFDKIAEKSITIHTATAYNEAAEQLRELQDIKEAQEKDFAAERAALRSEIRRLDDQNQQMSSQLSHLEGTIEDLEGLLQQARLNVEQTHSQYEESHAKNETYQQDLRQQQQEEAQQLLAMERSHSDQVQATNRSISGYMERIASLEKDVNLMAEENKLLMTRDEDNKKRIEELQTELRKAREEGDEARSILTDTVRELEADGDRAQTKTQLETARQTVQELQQKLAVTGPQLSSLRSQNSILQSDLSSLREELQRTAQELATSNQAENAAHQHENSLRAELTFANNALLQLEAKLERNERMLAQVFEVAIAYRNSHAKALSQAQAMLRPIAARAMTAPNGPGGTNMGESTLLNLGPATGLDLGSPPRGSLVGPLAGPPNPMSERPPSPTPIDPSDPFAALELLREFDLDTFADTIAKTGMTIRKWQKQCKEYRDRAKGKISFRNFQKGDLALFLPTRNSVAKPWAAFNVSFPHYFLNATGHIAEQLKTREWIVARIVSITEHMVDGKDPTSNPYGLGNGVKYYMLEVEDWTLNTPNTSVRPKAPRNGSSQLRPTSGPIETWRDSTILSQSPPPSTLNPVQYKQDEDPDILEGIAAIKSRPRAHTGSSLGAGPSSLSKLLAQANKDSSPIEKADPLPSSPPNPAPKDSPKPESPLPAEDPPNISEPLPEPSEATEGKLEQDIVPAKATPPTIPATVNQPAITSPRLHLSPRNSPRASPRQRPVSLHIAGGSPLATTSNVNVQRNTTITLSGNNRRTDSVRSSMSSVRPTSILKRPPFALSSSPSKAVLTTQPITDIISPTAEPSSPFRVSSESLNGGSRVHEDIQETPSPADSVTDGMNSVYWGHTRQRTGSTITPATAALTQTVSREHRPSAPSPLSGVFAWPWRRKRTESTADSGSEATRRLSVHNLGREQRVAASEPGGAASLLRRLDNSRE